jgi:bifunctional UDP-N-acetylglucosamine pyrophosphorylase/glucosamine-1-phosphate N-acetyltransferase
MTPIPTPPLHIVVLAAGKGTRMKSELPKVLHHVGGAPIISYVLDVGFSLNPVTATIVVGHMAESVRTATATRWPGVKMVVQEPQFGTAHALMQTEPVLKGQTGTVVLLYGDVPLLRPESVRKLLAHHQATGAVLTVLTATVKQPKGYGRIVRDGAGKIERIVEERDATDAQRAIPEINSGIYAFEVEPLFDALRQTATKNAQGEYYLTDLVEIYRRHGRVVEAFQLDDPNELLGINSREELALMNTILRDQRNRQVMASGVTLVDPATTWIGPDVEIGQDTVIQPNVYLEGKTTIGRNCEIQAGVRIIDSTLADQVLVQNYTIIRNSTVASGAILGPFTHIRPDSQIESGAHVGNFVELKKTRLGAGSKANHLAYLGDAIIGEKVNVGAGVITCNYDGVHKHQTIIEDGAFVGTDSQLVAPVRIGRDSYVAAGSSITEDVPAGALAISRGRQTNKEGWAAKKKAMQAAEKARLAETKK